MVEIKPVKMDIIDSLHLAIENYKKDGDESKFRQKLGGIKGAHPLTYRNTLLLK